MIQCLQPLYHNLTKTMIQAQYLVVPSTVSGCNKVFIVKGSSKNYVTTACIELKLTSIIFGQGTWL